MPKSLTDGIDICPDDSDEENSDEENANEEN